MHSQTTILNCVSDNTGPQVSSCLVGMNDQKKVKEHGMGKIEYGALVNGGLLVPTR